MSCPYGMTLKLQWQLATRPISTLRREVTLARTPSKVELSITLRVAGVADSALRHWRARRRRAGPASASLPRLKVAAVGSHRRAVALIVQYGSAHAVASHSPLWGDHPRCVAGLGEVAARHVIAVAPVVGGGASVVLLVRAVVKAPRASAP